MAVLLFVGGASEGVREIIPPTGEAIPERLELVKNGKADVYYKTKIDFAGTDVVCFRHHSLSPEDTWQRIFIRFKQSLPDENKLLKIQDLSRIDSKKGKQYIVVRLNLTDGNGGVIEYGFRYRTVSGSLEFKTLDDAIEKLEYLHKTYVKDGKGA